MVLIAINIKTNFILGVELLGQHGTNPTAAFLHQLTEEHNFFDTVFPVDDYGYQAGLTRLGLSRRPSHIYSFVIRYCNFATIQTVNNEL